jgi:6-phosphogluconate dehydrogenase (decarboxylating)
MQLGMIGLGRMGSNMVRRLLRDGYDCVVYDDAMARGRDAVPAQARFVPRGGALASRSRG